MRQTERVWLEGIVLNLAWTNSGDIVLTYFVVLVKWREPDLGI